MDPPKTRRAQRNLPHLSLAPLSTLTSIDALASKATETSSQWTPTAHSSYIAGKSAPSTPGILSRSSSRNRLSSAKSLTHLSFAADTLDRHADAGHGYDYGDRGLAKSKSTTVLLPSGHTSLRRKRLRLVGAGAGMSASGTATNARKSATRVEDDGEWFFRAGAVISNEARESKGQSWLASRESSTSLVAMGGDDDEIGIDELHYQDNRAFSTRSSRNASRAVSRVSSAKTSRRPSGVSTRPDMTFSTPHSARTPVRDVAGISPSDYFGGLGIGRNASVVAMGPDFVDDPNEDEDEDDEDEDLELSRRLEEAEVARLAQDRGFGLGGLVDKLMGWTLFDVKEDGLQEPEEEEEVVIDKQEPPRTPTSASVREHVPHSSPVDNSAGGTIMHGGDARHKGLHEAGGGDDEGGWKDAAWLLSVASKVLL